MHLIIFVCALIFFLFESNISYAQNETYPELNSSYFEADMILNAMQQEEILENFPLHKYLANKRSLWPNRVVLYGISTKFADVHLKEIKKAITHIENSTANCIKFRLVKPGMTAYVAIENDGLGCYADVGYQGMEQILNLDLDSGCVEYGTIVHQLLHTLGLFHQHSAYNRNSYIKLLKRNIDPEMERHFKLVPKHVNDDYGLGYDYESIMHFPINAFSLDGKSPTIQPTKNTTLKIGQRSKLSERDITKIRRMYGCDEGTETWL